MNFQKAYDLIKQAQEIAIIGHIRPDGDCIGSALAINSHIEILGKATTVFSNSDIPVQLSYLEGYGKIQTKFPENEKFDLLIVLDLNQSDRMGVFEPLLKCAKKVLCLDHHIGTPDFKTDVTIANSDYASCGEIIYEFFTSQKIKITKQMANALYTSISTDTGCFLYPATTAHTHLVAAELIKLGCDIELINYMNFRVFDKQFIMGLKQIFRNLRFKHDGQISYSMLKRASIYDDSQQTKFKQSVSDIKGVRASIIAAQERRNVFHISLRSHGNVNVEIPARHFGGGGHKNAAGFTIRGKYKKIIKQIITEVEKLLISNERNN